jgi:hypothetical protein
MAAVGRLDDDEKVERHAMTRLTLSLVVGVTLTLTGCDSSPRLETSSDEAMSASLEKMNAALPPDKRQELTRSIAVLVAPRLAEASKPGAFGAEAPTTTQAELLRPFDGMTAGQLIAKAKEQAK